MPAFPFPNILNHLALAGDRGLFVNDDSEAWQDIERARGLGFPLEFRDGRIYLAVDPDVLVPAWIEEETPCISWDRLCVTGFFELGSTNEEALKSIRQGAHNGLLIYTELQTAGRGRKGRRWISTPRGGLCFTLVLQPEQPLQCWSLLTHVTSVALVQTLKALPDLERLQRPLETDIKWPNDVLLSGKKVAGILVETTRGNRPLSAAAVGVGINVGFGSVPVELRNQATSISDQAGFSVPRRRLLVEFLYRFQLGYDLFQRGEHEEILNQWKSFSSMWEGVPIWIIEGDHHRPAVTCGLSEFGALRVRTEEGAEETLMAGDISVRRP